MNINERGIPLVVFKNTFLDAIITKQMWLAQKEQGEVSDSVDSIKKIENIVYMSMIYLECTLSERGNH